MNKKGFLFFLVALVSLNISAQLVPYRVANKWGYSDTSGKIIIEPAFQQADFFEEGVAFVMTDSLYYLIDKTGNVLSDKFAQYGKFVGGLCPVKIKGGKCHYINTKGQQVFNITFSAAENFSEGLAVVSMKNKLGIFNTKGEWVREPSFDSSSVYFKSGFLLAKNNGKFFYINNHGKNFVLPDTVQPGGIFSEGMAAVYVTHKIIKNNTSNTKVNLKFIDTTGKVVLSSFISDSLEDYADYVNYQKEFTDGKAIITVMNQLGFDRYFIDKKGKFSHLFSYAQHLGDSMFLGVFGYYLPSIRIYDKHFYVMGEFNSADLVSVGVFGNGLLPVQNKAGYWGYCNDNAQMVISFIYEKAFVFTNGYAIVVKQGKYGVINTSGKEFFRENLYILII